MIDDSVEEFGNAFSASIPTMFAKLCEGPLVLSHSDWRLDNLFFTDDDDVIAVDWQLIDRSVGLRDLSYLVTQSLNIDEPEGYQAAFDTYVDDLTDLGVDVDRNWAWEKYRLGTMFGFVYPVVACGALHPRRPAPRRAHAVAVPPQHRRVEGPRRVRRLVVTRARQSGSGTTTTGRFERCTTW